MAHRGGSPLRLVLAFQFVSTAVLWAVPININPEPSVAASSVIDAVTGADMQGLVVTAVYDTPYQPTILTTTWTSTGPGSGSASWIDELGHSLLTISVAGDSGAEQAWHYTSNFLSLLASLEFDGTGAGIYFDRAGPNPGTPGSGAGSDIEFGPLFLPSGNIMVTYSAAVHLDGNSPQNDLYAKLKIDFGDRSNGGGLTPQDFTFTQDTDRAAVPESASIIDGLSGLALVCALRRFFPGFSRRTGFRLTDGPRRD